MKNRFTLWKRLVFSLLLALVADAGYAQTGWTNLYAQAKGSAWARASSLALDTNGNVFVTTTTTAANYTVSTIKYSNEGAPMWTNTYSMAGGSDAYGIATDKNGNVFVLSYSLDAGDNAYCVTLKYSDSGAPMWTNIFTYADDSEPVAIAVDTNGNVFMTAYQIYPSTYYYITVKYSNLGTPLWTNFFAVNPSSPDAYETYPSGIVVDTNGNAFVTGVSNGTNCTTIKCSSAGISLWTNYCTAPSAFEGGGSAMAMDANGNIFVAGYLTIFSNSVITGNSLILKYANDGTPLWTNFNSTFSWLAGKTMAVDSSGNVFLLGELSLTNYATLKYSNDGTPLWTNIYSMALGATPNAIAVDSGGNVLVTGLGKDANTNDYYATVKYSNGGVPLLTNLYTIPIAGGYPYNYFTGANAIAVDTNGNVFVTGGVWATPTNEDCATIKYPNGLPPAPVYLGIRRLYNQVVLSWTNSGYNLQFAPQITGVYSNVLGATSPYTNPTTSRMEFFRLVQ